MFQIRNYAITRSLQLLDLLTVTSGYLLALVMRDRIFGGHIVLSRADSTALGVLCVLIFIASNHVCGVYIPLRSTSVFSDAKNYVRSGLIGTFAFMSLLYFCRAVDYSRSLLICFVLLNFLLALLARACVRSVLRRVRARGLNQKRIILVGSTSAAQKFVESLERYPWYGYRVVGVIDVDKDRGTPIPVPKLGGLDCLEQNLRSAVVDYVIAALPADHAGTLTSVITTCESYGVQTLIIPDYFDVLPARPRFESFAGLPLIDTRRVPLDEWPNALIKRTLDIVLSAIALLFLSPVFAFISVGVKLTSPGPVFHVQERIGKNNSSFKMYKFRSMRHDPEASREAWTTADDPRKTKFGSFLRRTSLDELPQFWNVLIGDMSIIGPRPERPFYVSKFRTEIPKYMVKHRVRPGITGWAQVNGWRGDTSIEERIKHDIQYIENWTFALDLKIFIRTITDGLIHPNAY